MASPQVAGTAALILSTGYRSATQLKADILDNVDPLPALAGKVRTGGRLDVCAALAACSTNPDSDGDGILDGDDSCPNTAGGGTVSGCPAVPRSITLAYGGATPRFSGSVSAPTAPGCASGRKVTIWNSLPGPDVKVLTTTSGSNGSFSVGPSPKPGDYFSRARAEIVAGVGECGEAKSPIVSVG
jgi:hypothetical protein